MRQIALTHTAKQVKKRVLIARDVEDVVLFCFEKKRNKIEGLGVKIILGSDKRHKEPCQLKNELCLPCDFYEPKKKLHV